jgi:hypothetical protein
VSNNIFRAQHLIKTIDWNEIEHGTMLMKFTTRSDGKYDSMTRNDRTYPVVELFPTKVIK